MAGTTSVVTSLGNGYATVDQYIINTDGTYQYSRTLDPTWDTSSGQDRTQDVLNYVLANNYEVLVPVVYNNYKTFFDANGGTWPGGRWYIGDINGYINDVLFPPPPPTRYDCVNGVCQPVTGGIYTDPACGGVCTLPPPPPAGCSGCDLTTNICLDFIGIGCQPKTYVIGTVVAVVALMLLR